MRYEEAWDRLLGFLQTWSDVREVAGGVEITFPWPSGGRGTVEIVMTPGDWEELTEVIGAETPRSLKERVLALDEDHPFLVCDSGIELLPSLTLELPTNPLDDFTPGSGEHWVVLDDAGNTVSRFADWDQEEH